MIPAEAVDALIDWYQVNRRDLPWRDTRDPYRILVSEIMLQQTQAERVVPKYHEFLRLFPTLAALADAPASEVIRAWSGLGYNRRALNLQRAAQAAMEQYDGSLPDSVEELRSLPGIGPYTAGAVACFAFEQDVGFVDTNIRRVLHRMVYGPDVPEPKVSQREIEELARKVVPAGRGYVWNQALMELGATICRSRVTECLLCPVSHWCASRGMMAAAIAASQSTGRPPAVPFRETSRYFRGKIVHYLRSAPGDGLTAAELARSIEPERDPDDPSWIETYLDGLLKDGLIVKSHRRIGEEAVPYDGIETTSEPEIRYRLPE